MLALLAFKINMIKYEALMEMYLFNMQLKKDDENGKPELATVTVPTNMMYEMAGIKTTENYYRVLAEDEPENIDGELGDKIVYIEPFRDDNTTTKKKETTAGAAARTTAADAAKTTAAAAATTKNPALQTTRKK